jgi:stage II sporulation protein M
MKFGENYIEVGRYMKEAKIYFLIIFALFFISSLIGFLFPVFLVEFIEELIRELVERTTGMNTIELFVFIFSRNLMTAFTGLMFGIILGLFPLFLTFFNGYVLGFVSNRVVGVSGLSVLWRLLPHGIFEFPALIISLGLGVKLASFILTGKPKKQLMYDLENSLRVFLFVVLPLLLIAAIIETSLIVFLS